MNRPGTGLQNSPCGSGSTANELEALQTDVMRFLAILALSLMVVFAVVHSLPEPEQQPDHRAAGTDADSEASATAAARRLSLARETEALVTRIRELRIQLERLRADRDPLQKTLQTARMESRDARSQMNEDRSRLERMDRELAAKSAALNRVKGELLAVQVSLKRQRADLASTEQQIRNVRLNLALARAQIETATRKLSLIRARAQTQLARPAEVPAPTEAKALKSSPLSASEPSRAPAPEPERDLSSGSKRVRAASTSAETASPAPPQTRPKTLVATQQNPGLTLRFQSPQALAALIASGHVGFYALSRKGAHRLHLEPSGPVFRIAVRRPSRFYEMATTTVPETFRRAAAERNLATGSGSVTWAVTLPARTEQEVRKLMAGHGSGILTIQADATVRFTGNPGWP